MYLKKLYMQGFKSFVDKISLNFGEGITAIVGPNGSGKSNISDAIRWVLGEQSARTLRGSKMEDIIFAGTEKRKPLGYAEVSITLDNSTGVFPIDYNEIEVTRKVYRSGESEYLINKALCRLRDIHELFMDTGLGRDGYSIIGQGRIDEILSAKSEDRRQVFEEAAGISKYRYKKSEAERKLDKTAENMVRLKDICKELEDRIEPLKLQSEKAKRYLDIREALKKLEVCMWVSAIKNLRLQTAQAEETFDSLAVTLKALEAEVLKLEEDEQIIYNKVREMDDEITKTRERMHSAEILSTQGEGETALLKSNIHNIELNIERLSVEIKALENDALSVAGDRDATNASLESLLLKQIQYEKELAGLLSDVDTAAGEIDEKNRHISDLNEKSLNLLRTIEDINARIENIEFLHDNFKQKLSRLEIDLENANTKSKEYGEEEENIHKALDDIISDLSEAMESIKTKTEEAAVVNRETENLKSEYNKINAEYTFKMSRLNALNDMEKSMEGYSRAVKTIISKDYRGGGVCGVLSKLITVPGEFVTAIEIAMGAALQNVVVETESHAKAAIEYLKSNSLGRATFLPVSSVSGNRLANEKEISSMKGFAGVAADLIKYDNKFNSIITNILGRCVIFDNMDNAVCAARKFGYRFKIVTLSGEALFPGGSISGGSMVKSAQILGRSIEIDELKKQCHTLSKQMDGVDNKIEDNLEKSHNLHEKTEALKQKEILLNNQKIKLAGDIERVALLKTREREEANRLKREIDELGDQAKKSDGGKAGLLETQNYAQAQYTVVNTRLDEERLALRGLIEKKEKISGDVMTLRLHINSLSKDEENLNARISSFEEKEYEIIDSIRTKQSDAASKRLEIDEINLKIKNKLVNIDEAKNRAGEFKNIIEELTQARNESEAGIREVKGNIKVKNDEMGKKREEYLKIESKLERDREAIEINISKLWDDYELTFSDALNYEFEITHKSAAKNKIAQLKSQIRGLGSINIDAIEEYKEVSERYGFLQNQLSDLEKAKAELEKLIIEVTKIMTLKFKEQFKIINEKFKESFSGLFGGGTANLTLTLPDAVLESGIEISAQPPGKKLQSLSLLSGGEKALTAISLLFAIIGVRPTPFCILDEIDAALDENNVTRFADYVKNLSGNTQFIVVTHRRGTMEAADILYGVAMQEKGVSKLLSMVLEGQ